MNTLEITTAEGVFSAHLRSTVTGGGKVAAVILAMFAALGVVAIITVLLLGAGVGALMFVVVFFIVGVMLPLRMVLWNLYGVEELIIAENSLSYGFDYRFWQSEVTTASFQQLGYATKEIRTKRKMPLVRFWLAEVVETDQVVNELYSSTLLLPQTEVARLLAELQTTHSIQKMEPPA